MANEGSPDQPDTFETVSCLLCGCADSRLVHLVWDRLQARLIGASSQNRQTYRIVACSACGFRFLNPRPRAQDLGKYYPGGLYDPHQRSGGGILPFLYRLLRPFSVGYKAGQAARGLKAGVVLDVGCGTGEFLSEMGQRGWQALGIEKDEGAARIARDSGCEVLLGDPLEVDLSDRTFDLITLWHVLEHLPNPREALARCAAHLRPEGRLVIALPNSDSLDARFYKSHWAAWDAPRHLYHFRPSDLQSLLKQACGHFRLLRIGSLPLDPFYHALLSEICWGRGWAVASKALRGLVIASLSFLRGLKPGQGSSSLFIFEKS